MTNRKTTKTWREKYSARTAPVTKRLEVAFAGMKPGEMMLISTPAEIEAWVRSIPSGSTRTVGELRSALALRHEADVTCPATTGIFLRIVCEIALEELAEGKPTDQVTPFWRVVDPSGPLASRLSCGSEWIRAAREAEQQ
jgi:hypothetical protein